ncbi:MAG: hypothetical protein NTV11_16450 [Rhodocyclales bacterium]|nr:hypothetical protein [Rhodocyclales bacterium]
MKAIGTTLLVIGWGLFVLLGLFGFIVCLVIIYRASGPLGLVMAFFLGPVTFMIAPLYAGFAWGDWTPAILIFGGSFPGAAMIALGAWMREHKPSTHYEAQSISYDGLDAEMLKIRPIDGAYDYPPRPTLEQEISSIRSRNVER